MGSSYFMNILPIAYGFFRVAGALSFPVHYWKIRRYLGSHQVRKLNIGCGHFPLPGWLNTDFNLFIKDAVYLDASARFPFPSGLFDFIFSEHLIEHLPYTAGLHFLKECSRVLKPGGRIRIATPDLQFLIGLYNPLKTQVQKEYIPWAGGKFLPEIKDPTESFIINNFFKAWGHRFIYDYKTLKRSLEECGFSNLVQRSVGQSDVPEFSNLEVHGKMIGEDFNRLETMVIEASK